MTTTVSPLPGSPFSGQAAPHAVGTVPPGDFAIYWTFVIKSGSKLLTVSASESDVGAITGGVFSIVTWTGADPGAVLTSHPLVSFTKTTQASGGGPVVLGPGAYAIGLTGHAPKATQIVVNATLAA